MLGVDRAALSNGQAIKLEAENETDPVSTYNCTV